MTEVLIVSHDMTYKPQRALELLRIGSGRAEANFRESQEDAVSQAGLARLLDKHIERHTTCSQIHLFKLKEQTWPPSK